MGRIFSALDSQAAGTGQTPFKGAAYSVAASSTIYRGSPTQPVLLSSADGMLTYDGSQTSSSAATPSSTQTEQSGEWHGSHASRS